MVTFTESTHDSLGSNHGLGLCRRILLGLLLAPSLNLEVDVLSNRRRRTIRTSVLSLLSAKLGPVLPLGNSMRHLRCLQSTTDATRHFYFAVFFIQFPFDNSDDSVRTDCLSGLGQIIEVVYVVGP
jgi:hypothetical protein